MYRSLLIQRFSMTKKLNNDQESAILLLRFRSENPTNKSLTYLTYLQIERATGIRACRVKNVCLKAIDRHSIAKRHKAL